MLSTAADDDADHLRQRCRAHNVSVNARSDREKE